MHLPRHIGKAGNLKYTCHKVGRRKYNFLHHIGKAGNSWDLKLSKEMTNSQHITALSFLIPESIRK
jgi:hypothetical protein